MSDTRSENAANQRADSDAGIESPHQLDKRYRDSRATFEGTVNESKRISQSAAGRLTHHPRQFWASVLFTKLVVTSISILCLSPRVGSLSRRDDHWDFSSVASLVRNLAECYLRFFYLCVDSCADEDEWQTRLNLVQLRDNCDRWRMFKEFNPSDPQLSGFEQLTGELTAKLKGRKYFLSLPEKKQNELLRGQKDHMSQDELMEKMGLDKAMFRGLYRFLSVHAHSLPMSFYRMAGQNRGRGVETPTEKGYMASALEIANDVIVRANRDMIAIFPDVAAKTPVMSSNRKARRSRRRFR